MNNGYIKLHRKLLDNPVVMKTNDHLAVWMYLLLNATHQDYQVLIGSKKVTLTSGQLITGRKKISKELKINESKVQRILKLFENDSQIEQRMNSVCRIISIVNWGDYQKMNNERTLNNNKRNTINIYIDQFEEFWNLYDKKVSRSKAESSYRSAMKKTDHTTIMSALTKQKKLWEGRDKAYIKHPTTWLNQECWNDEIEDLQPAKPKPSKKVFQKTPSGLYKAWCMKCGGKLLPSEFQLRQSSDCCGVELLPDDPKIDNSKEIKNMEEIYGRLGMG